MRPVALGERNVGWRGRSCGGLTFRPRSGHNVGQRAKARPRATLFERDLRARLPTQPPLTFGIRDTYPHTLGAAAAYGRRRPGTLRVLREEGYQPATWSVTGYDWRTSETAKRIGRRAVRAGSGTSSCCTTGATRSRPPTAPARSRRRGWRSSTTRRGARGSSPSRSSPRRERGDAARRGGRRGAHGAVGLGLGFLFFLAGMEIDFARIDGGPLRRGAAGWPISLAVAFTASAAIALTGVDVPVDFVAAALCTTAFGTLLPVLRDGLVPVFLLALLRLLLRGVPALLYGQVLGGRDRVALATISATSLPLIVAITATVDLAAGVPLGA